ncbi:recombinase family protein [Streptomyces daliensis]
MRKQRQRGTVMTSFAFAGRVSTEDQQDPVASYNWQMSRARSLLAPDDEIVAEYFDIGSSRSLPWPRRPRAAALLSALKQPDRGFDAVVIGEPQRAFYGNQFGLTFPVFVHYGVQLWVPEVGGRIDPDSEAHDLVMSVFGGMSKAERNRIKIRVRSSMSAQAKIEGRFLGGRPPYGYRLADAGPHPNPAKAADGKRLHRLEPDPGTAPVVQRIFREYLAGFGIFAIAQRLTADGVLCPSAADRSRNPHRSGAAWSKSAVRAILTNPRYTGHQVWNRQHKHESLIDVDNVALGHHTKLTWNPEDAWIHSDQPAHTPLISPDIFRAAGQRLASRGPASAGREVVRTRHPYVFKGRITHHNCGRKMQGNHVRDTTYYRCRYPQEYAIANTLDHPLNVLLKEEDLLGPLDGWLARAFAPHAIEESLTAMHEAQPAMDVESESARRTLLECDRKLARHRAALEAGADPVLIAQWSREATLERTAAQERVTQLTERRTTPPHLSRNEIRALIDGLGGMLNALRRADPTDKAEVYSQLGLQLSYDHTTKVVQADIRPAPPVGIVFVSEGGLEPPRPIKGTSTSS